MNFTAKEDYGIRAVVDIALNRGETPVQAREIAERQEIPEQFLEQVLATLRRAGIIRSIRGAGGGYDLARPASQIMVGDILRTLSGPLAPMRCVEAVDGEGCERQSACAVAELWRRVRDAISGVVDTTTIQDLAERQSSYQQSQSFMMNI